MAAPLRRLVVPVRSIVVSRIIGRRPVTCHRWLHVSRRCCSEQWQLVSAVCLERFPITTQPKNKIEEDFSELMAKLELEYSHLSDHELRHLEDLRLAERRKSEEYEESDAEVVRQTAVEAEDAWDAELQTFQPASRLTEADTKNDLTSLDRKLDQKLVLFDKTETWG
ncbi:39S ribosomal protein L46, mitochondrial [Lamellibrachia satsuma]|nr:39S ribosomal protein L46, mitochondrial [Lamellibrachia satsuma]